MLAANRPGPEPEAVSVEEELARVMPVIEEIAGERLRRSSQSTHRRQSSRAQPLDAGASIVNDITGGRADPEMMTLVAESGAAFIIMHMQGTPRTMQVASAL